MADLGWQELVIILVIVMIFFGAGKLPEIAKSLGQGVKAFREEANAPAPSGEMAAGGAPGTLDLAPALAVVRSRPPLDARDAAEV